MAVRLSELRTSRTLLPRNIIIIMFLVLISVRGGWLSVPLYICALEVQGLFLRLDKTFKLRFFKRSSLLWVVAPCRPVNVKRSFGRTCLSCACFLRHAVLLFGLFFALRMEAICSSEMCIVFHRITRRCIPENRNAS
jgi:hypothetical protein